MLFLLNKMNLLFGIIGGVFLVFLQLPLFLSDIIGGRVGFIVEYIKELLSFGGLILVIYFSILLIIGTIKTIHKK